MVMAGYEKALADARAHAQSVMAATAADISSVSAGRQAQFNTDLAAKTRATEERINEAKETALASVRSVAAEIAQQTAEKLAGIKVDASSRRRGCRRRDAGAWLMFQAAEFWVALATIIFAVLAFRPGAKAVTAMLDDRADKIRQELEEAQRLREDAQATLASYQRRQRDALKEAEDIIAHAREEAERLRLHSTADLEAAMKRRETQAMDKIAQAEALALQEVKNLTVDIAVAAGGRLLAQNLDAQQSAKLIDASIADLRRNLH